MKYLYLTVFFCLTIGRTYAQNGYTVQTLDTIWASPPEGSLEDMPLEGNVTNAGAAFRAKNGFPANPTINGANFTFDYKIKQHVITPVYTGEIVYYVNSHDGSIAFTADDNPVIAQYFREWLNKGEFHFGIRKGNGNLLICGVWKEAEGGSTRRAVYLDKSNNASYLWADTYLEQMQWLGDAAALSSVGLANALTPAQVQVMEDPRVTGQRGTVFIPEGNGDQLIDFYFIDYPTIQPISIPFMGLGVGIFKDSRHYINQLTVYSVYRDVYWEGKGKASIHNYLLGLYKAHAVFRPNEYTDATAFKR